MQALELGAGPERITVVYRCQAGTAPSHFMIGDGEGTSMNVGIGCLAVLMALVLGLGGVLFATSSTTSETVVATAAPMVDGSPTP